MRAFPCIMGNNVQRLWRVLESLQVENRMLRATGGCPGYLRQRVWRSAWTKDLTSHDLQQLNASIQTL